MKHPSELQRYWIEDGGMFPCDDPRFGEWLAADEALAEIAARDAEIDRLKARVAELEAKRDGDDDREPSSEPNGGNVNKPHPLMLSSGEFWRCAHGSTGLADGFEWVGCHECDEVKP